MLQDNPPDNPENSNFAHGNHRWTRKTMTMKTDTDFKSDNNALVSEKYLGMRHADKGTAEEVVTVDEMPLKAVESGATPKYVTDIWLRVKSDGNGLCRFFYSTDGHSFKAAGEAFHAREGRWIGAKTGFFCSSFGTGKDRGWIDIDYIRFE